LRRRGTSLVETMIFFLIAIVVIGMAWQILFGGVRIGRTAVEGVALQQGIRNLMENMVRDVNGAYMIAQPNGSSPFPEEEEVILYLHRTEQPPQRGVQDPRERAEINGPLYPFASVQGETSYSLPVWMVRYRLERNGVIRRFVDGGRLVSNSDLASGGIVSSFGFQPFTGQGSRGSRSGQVMARNVEFFRTYPFGYDITNLHPQLLIPMLTPTQDLPGSGERYNLTSMLTVSVKANYHPEVQDQLRAQDSSMRMVTKIWCYPRVYELLYSPYFSSVDEDLRY
jgi:hypothetical protein